MCGIVALINPRGSALEAQTQFELGRKRGPDRTMFMEINEQVWLGFHRLSINGMDEAANQPMKLNGVYLVCNGEIYNSAELYNDLGITPFSGSDCEVILHLYERFGILAAVRMLDSTEFAFVLYDSNINRVYAARDPFGVRPLYRSTAGTMVAFSSEIKTVVADEYAVFPPGHVETLGEGLVPYTALPLTAPCNNLWMNDLQLCFYEAVRKRVLNTQRPIACLLSGGFDSSLVAVMVNMCRRELGVYEPLETYSIGLEGSEDLKYAAIMANYLQSKHTSIVVSEADFFGCIPEVIREIESYDTTTVRASVGNYLVAKHIAAHSEAKVIFNGDGADELAGGYLYFLNSPGPHESDMECRRLLGDIHYFDALRSDRCISANGLEARTPFLDRAFVHAYLALPAKTRFPENMMEKHVFRQMFKNYLPEVIRLRRKEAFSDGVSALNRSWYCVIQSLIPPPVEQQFQAFLNHPFRHTQHNAPKTAEQYYYRSLFESFYPSAATVIPYMWMPKFVNTNECSARALATY